MWPLATMQGVTRVAREAGVALHMDGARLCNASVKSGVKASDYAACVDSLWLDYTKGLGAPVGASIAGSKDFIKEAWRQKQMLGGSMRQSGVIAAAALYALEHNWDRLAEDHDNARHLSEGLANIEGIEIDVPRMETNLVFFEVRKPGWTSARLVEACKERGVGIGANTATRIRAVHPSRRQPRRHRYRAEGDQRRARRLMRVLRLGGTGCDQQLSGAKARRDLGWMPERELLSAQAVTAKSAGRHRPGPCRPGR